MDRFIGKILLSKINSSGYLKSNMDRFIVKIDEEKALDLLNLKSNMDRFIEPFEILANSDKQI